MHNSAVRHESEPLSEVISRDLVVSPVGVAPAAEMFAVVGFSTS